MRTFNEYLNSKGNVEDAKVDIHGDRTDPMTPPNSPKGGGKPYSSDGKCSKKKGEKGFGDQGDKNLIFKPDIENANKNGAKIPTAEFAQYELVPLISESIEKNPFITETIVRDLKRRGLLGTLVGELMEHRETYKHLATIMGHKTQGQQVCQKLVRAMSEEISPPFGSNHDDEEDMGDEGDFEDAGLDDVEVDGEMDDFDMTDDMDDEDSLEMGGEPCPMCDGEEGNEECELCHGTGFVDDEGEMADDMDAMGELNGMGGGETDPNLAAPSPAMANFQRAMMGRM